MARCSCEPYTIFKKMDIPYFYAVYYNRAYHRTIYLSGPGEDYSLYKRGNSDQYSYLSLHFTLNNFNIDLPF